MRQMHHWSADIFIASIVVHMARIFFTGAFRKPRELNWTIGITLLILAILNGFIGYSLPDDLVSGTGLRIAYSILLSIPFVGSYLASFLWGGNFPGHIIIERFYIIHVLIIPLVILGLLGAHLGLLVRQKHTQFPGKGRTEHNVVGTPMFPTFMAKTTGFLLMVGGGIGLLAGLAQINPIWQFGPYTDASKISYAVQPDWYMGLLDGALRIMPSWEWTGWGHTVPWEVLFPAVIFPGLLFNLCFAWPFLERHFTKDNELHNLLDRPRDRPKRTAAGAAVFALVFTLFAASSTDVLANFFHVSLNVTLWFFRIAVFVVPVVVGFASLADLPRDAGRPRDRQAQAGARRLAERGRRVHRRAVRAPPGRRPPRARSRAGAPDDRARAGRRRRRSPDRDVAGRRRHRCPASQPLVTDRNRPPISLGRRAAIAGASIAPRNRVGASLP